MSLKYKRSLIPRAKGLRKNATKQENHLWYDFLRTYPVRFQRQKVIDGFIVDFYCCKAKLIIEIDGSQHYTDKGIVNDEKRTQVLNKYDLAVLRFSNLDVDRNFYGVCTMIEKTIKERINNDKCGRTVY